MTWNCGYRHPYPEQTCLSSCCRTDTDRRTSCRRCTADAYTLSPGRKALLQLFGAGHALGGVSGYDAAEATDENPELADAALWLTWAFLRTELGLDEHAWDFASNALTSAPAPLGRIESR